MPSANAPTSPLSQEEIERLLPFCTPEEKAELTKLLADLGMGLMDCREPPEWFHDDQKRAWLSRAIDVAVIAGFQSGKTAQEPYWILREIQRCAPFIKWLGFGRVIFAGPTLTLMGEQALPAFRLLFEETERLGTYLGGNKPSFRFSAAGTRRLLNFEADVTVRFAYTNDSSNLESVTACCGAWDEAGQKENKQESFEAFNRRLEIGRATTFGKMAEWIREDPERLEQLQWWLDTYFADEGPDATFGRRFWGTTPYEWNWFKAKVYDRALRGESGYAIFNFPTWANPRNSKERCMAAKSEMPEWRWLMMYTGVYTKPAGAIYDCFERHVELSPTPIPPLGWAFNTCKRFRIPDEWPVESEADFGDVNTAALFDAVELQNLGIIDGVQRWGEPTGRLFFFAKYKKAGRTNEEHAWAHRAYANGLISEFEDAYSKWQADPNRPLRKVDDRVPPDVILTVLNRCTKMPDAVGGSHQEQGWRDSYALGGLRVAAPPNPKGTTGQSIVSVGISCGYRGVKERQAIFFDDLDDGFDDAISQIENYSLEIDDQQEPIDGKIQDKGKQHFCDCYRYRASKQWPAKDNAVVSSEPKIQSSPVEEPKRELVNSAPARGGLVVPPMLTPPRRRW